jgi:hypothetical protein
MPDAHECLAIGNALAPFLARAPKAHQSNQSFGRFLTELLQQPLQDSLTIRPRQELALE